MTITARPATRADIAPLSAVLGNAFQDDPVVRWVLPDEELRERRLHRLWAAVTRHQHLSRGGVEVAGSGAGIGAATLWDPPGRWQPTRREELRALPRLLLTFGSSLKRAQIVAELAKRVHPEEPHWYLAIIGSDPAVRGEGYGNVLMRSRLDRCDAEGAPAYLESSNPDNVPYYQRFGFHVTGEIHLPDGGPTLVPMWRTPR